MLLSAAVVAQLLGTIVALQINWANVATDLNDQAKSLKAVAVIRNHFKSTTDIDQKNFFENLDQMGAEVIVTKLTGAKTLDDLAAVQFGDFSSMKTFLGQIRSGSRDLINENVCGPFNHVLELFNESHLKNYNAECRKMFLTSFGKRLVRERTFGGVNVWAEEVELIKDAINLRKEGSKHLSTKVWKNLVHETRDEKNMFCSGLDANVLTAIVLTSEAKEKLAEITPGCFASMDNIATANLSKVIPFMKSDIFALYSGALTAETIKAMSAEQLAKFSASTQEDIKCQLLNLTSLVESQVSGLTPECLNGYYNVAGNTMGSKIKYIPDSKWASFNPELYANIAFEDLKHLSPVTVSLILKNSEAVEKLANKAGVGNAIFAETAAKITVTSTEMQLLAEHLPLVASMIIANNTTLPEDVLAKLEISQIAKLSTQDALKTGYEFFDTLVAKDHILARFSRMGSQAEVHHCSAVTLENYIKYILLRSHSGESCRANLPLNTFQDLKLAPELFKSTEDIVSEVLQSKRLSDVYGGLANVLFNDQLFCSKLALPENEEVLKNMSDETLHLMGSFCAAYLKPVMTKELAVRLGDSAFSTDCFTDGPITFEHLRLSQIPFVATKCVGKSVFETMDAAKYEALPPLVRGAFSGPQIAKLPTTVLTTIFTAETIKVTPAMKFDSFTDAQLKALEKSALLAFNIQHLQVVGSAVDSELKPLVEIMSDFDEAHQAALKVRIENINAAKIAKAAQAAKSAPSAQATTAITEASSSSMFYWIAGGFIAIIVIAGAVYLIVGRK